MTISTLIEKLEEIHCNAPNGGVPVVMTGKEWLALRAALDDTLLAIELREVLDEPEVVVRRHPHDPIGGAYIAVVQA